MPQDSKRKRQLRRLKRDRTNALKLFDFMHNERNMYRAILEEAQKRYTDKIVEESKKNEAEASKTAAVPAPVEVVPENGGQF